MQDDCVCASEVEALPACAGGEQEGKDVVVVVEAIHRGQPLIDSCSSRKWGRWGVGLGRQACEQCRRKFWSILGQLEGSQPLS